MDTQSCHQTLPAPRLRPFAAMTVAMDKPLQSFTVDNGSPAKTLLIDAINRMKRPWPKDGSSLEERLAAKVQDIPDDVCMFEHCEAILRVTSTGDITIAVDLGNDCIVVDMHKIYTEMESKWPGSAAWVDSVFNQLPFYVSTSHYLKWIQERETDMFMEELEHEGGDSDAVDVDNWNLKWSKVIPDYLKVSPSKPIRLSVDPVWVAVERLESAIERYSPLMHDYYRDDNDVDWPHIWLIPDNAYVDNVRDELYDTAMSAGLYGCVVWGVCGEVGDAESLDSMLSAFDKCLPVWKEFMEVLKLINNKKGKTLHEVFNDYRE